MNPETRSRVLRIITVVAGIIALGLMADIFDEFKPLEEPTGGLFHTRKEKTFLGVVVVAEIISILFLILSFLKMNVATVDASLHGLLIIVVSIGWGMYAGWVADIEHVYEKYPIGDDTPAHEGGRIIWLAKAGAALALTGINLPLYLAIAVLAFKNRDNK